MLQNGKREYFIERELSQYIFLFISKEKSLDSMPLLLSTVQLFRSCSPFFSLNQQKFIECTMGSFTFAVRWSLLSAQTHNDGTCCFHSCGLFGTALLWKCSKMAYQQKQIKTMTNWDFNKDTKKEQQQQNWRQTERKKEHEQREIERKHRNNPVQDGYKTMSRLKAYAVTFDFNLCSLNTQLNKYENEWMCARCTWITAECICNDKILLLCW